ncbi:MAG: hypothetical protein IT436_14730 [Phycisphaerales bacterium]|nr:hypothetical protein [Phycisphaerales bacterium]
MNQPRSSPRSRPRTPLPVRLAAPLVLLAAAGPALAQGARENQPQRSERALEARTQRDWNAGLRFFGEYVFKTDLDDDQGKVSVARGGGVLEVDAPIGDRSRLSFTLATEYSSYSFDDAQGFAQGFEEPWGDVFEHSLSAIFTTQPSDRWSYILGGGIRASYEQGASFDDSLTGQGIAGFNYKFSDTFNAGLGVVVRSQIEDDVSVFPLILFDWRISEKWRFNGKAGGPGVVLSYQATDSLSFSLEGDYQTRTFRLSDDGPAPDGVGSDERLQLALGADWKVAEQVRLRGRIGANLYERYNLLDRNGVQITDREADPTPFVGLELRFDF